MTLQYFIWMVVACGAFGGLVSAIIFKDQNHVKSILKETPETKESMALREGCCAAVLNDVGFFIGRILIGVGGAFGVIFVGFWTKSISIDANVENQLLLIGLCIVIGTFSHRFLPHLADQIEARLGAAEKKMKQIEVKAMEVERNVKKANSTSLTVADYASTITFAKSTENDEINNDRLEAIERLERLKSAFPKDRTLNLLIGRLYKREKNYDKAIITLSDYAKILIPDLQKREKPESVVADCADAYFNMACYHALKSQENAGSERQRLRKEALDILKMSIDLLPANKEYAAADDDFSCFDGDTDFNALLGR